ncbi:helix-turn-helix domain-containing protein [Streptomyces termitum]|uniref:helix-turn-helix domain-containing protein n=1 Tax=Streptomyces termitum TaxID=67368 RepID=UPI0033AA7373
MAGWTALDDGLDPDVRAFTERLRLLVERSGLGVVAVAERTGRARADWDAYLDARRPVPRSAVVALSDATGADLGSLTAQWEHADRAWKHLLRERAIVPAPAPAPEGAPDPTPPPGSGPVPPPEGVPAEHTIRMRPVPASAPAPAAAREHAAPTAPAPARHAPARARRASPLLYAAGVVGALLVATAAVLLADLGGSEVTPAAPTAPATTPAPTTASPLPDGVRCAGEDCAGRDPELMGCGGPLAATAARTRIGGALVEVRYSATCGGAWARISGAAPGDEVSVQAGTAVEVANVPAGGDTDAYTLMIAARSPDGVRACAHRSSGADGCTDG